MTLAKKTALPQLDTDEAFVGQRLRERRLAMKMTQGELGAVADVSFQQIQKYERGVNRIAFSTLQKFAAALNTPIQYFLRDNASQPALASPLRQASYAAPDNETQEMVRLMADTDDATRRQLLQLAKALIGTETAAPAKKKSKG